MTAVLAFLPALAIGLLILLLAWPGPYRRDLLLKTSLALALGPGVTSCLYFVWSLFLRPRSRFYFAAEALLIAALLLLLFLRRARKNALPPLFSPPPPTRLDRLLLAVFCLFLALAAAGFVLQTLMMPHGVQDAWNIWNMRARFLFRGSTDWTALFSPQLYWLNHPDYPFLITAGTARAWSFAGRETTLVPALQAALYAAGLSGLLFSAVAARRTQAQGALAAIFLSGMPLFILLAGWQIADVPLAFFIAASAFLLVLCLEHPGQAGLGFLLGLCAGLAAWTKNEGIPWLGLVMGAYLLGRLRARVPLKTLPRELLPIAAGAALPLAALLYLKAVLAPASDLFADQSAGSLIERLLDPQRAALTFGYTLKALAGISPIGLTALPVLPAALLFLALFFPPRSARARLRFLLFPAAALLLQGIIYFGIYLITPHDLVWHLRTAVDRLIFHLTPAALLLVFLTIRAPHELLDARSK